MPELPEVENIKLGLENKIKNRKIINIEYSEKIITSHKEGKFAVVKDDLKYFKNNISGKKILNLTRRGKYLYFTLDKGYLVCHFGMTGAFFVVNNVEEIENKNYQKHKHVIFNLDNNKILVFSDIRRFGEMRYLETIENFKPFLNLAPEPFAKESENYFLNKLAEKKYAKEKIKPLLLDGNIFCGCGNIYACEVLYKQKINPEIVASDLTLEEKKKLFHSLVEILNFSISQGGSTISDFVHSDGEEGNMQNFLQIYGKKVCPKGHNTENITLKTRSTYYCPICQKDKR